MTPYLIEVNNSSEDFICHPCDKVSRNGHGFVYKDSDAYAVYYVGWSNENPERMVTIALAIGEWDDDSTVDDRTCFGLEAYEEQDNIQLRVIEPNESPWAHTELLGPMLNRSEGLKHSLLKEVFLIIEEILYSHKAINQYLSFSQ